MHRPDGMGADRYNERQHMKKMAHLDAREANWAVVTRYMDVLKDGFDSREAARQWVEERLNTYPEPEWDKSEVEVQDIG